MLDVGFSEILLTSAIALIVLGPERLPKVARQVGNWMGRARAMARQLTEQLEREVNAEELLRQTKTNSGNSAGPVSSAPAAFDTSYSPNPPASNPPASPPQFAAPPASAPAYSPEPAATPIGADWHVSPPVSKPDND